MGNKTTKKKSVVKKTTKKKTISKPKTQKKIIKKKITQKVNKKKTKVPTIKKIPQRKKITSKSKIQKRITKKNIPQKIKITSKNKKTKKETFRKKIIKKIKKTIHPKVKTGISTYDNMIEGGFQNKSVNLIVGGLGSGKTIFSLQFLIEGLKRKEKVLYITFEEKKEEFYRNMKQLGWNLEKDDEKENFIFLEYSPEKVKMMLDEGGGAIESIVLKHKIKRIVIDSITSFSLLFDDDLEKRQAMLGLFDIIRKWNCTILLTVQNNPANRGAKGVPLIEFEADSLTILHFLNINNQRKRFIEILKMRGTNHSTETHNFTIQKNKGIVIGKKAKINPHKF